MKLSTLYEYDSKADEIVIQSKFSSIPSRSCTIRETKVNMRDRIKWGNNTPCINKNNQNLIKMPTLKIKNFIASEQQDKRRKYYVVELKNEVEQKVKL